MIVLHIISGLKSGGAEGCLYSLVTHDKGNKHIIISLTGMHHYGEQLVNAGFDVQALGYKPGAQILLRVFSLARVIRKIQPDVVQTWMYHADLVGGIASRLAGIPNIVWNIRMSNPWDKRYGLGLKIIVCGCAILSRFVPRSIVCCAESARQIHISSGYDSERMRVVLNGYDFSRFSEENLEPMEGPITLGVVGRWDPIKHYPFLLETLALLVGAQVTNWRLVMIGTDLDDNNLELTNCIHEHGLNSYVCLVGPQREVEIWYQKIDLLISCSLDEGFPNVVAEALCSGVPALVSDVGDSGQVVGDTGWIVEADDTEALLESLKRAVEHYANHDSWRDRRKHCRERAHERFDIQLMVGAYNDVWQSVQGVHR